MILARSLSPITVRDIRDDLDVKGLRLSAARVRHLARKYDLPESEIAALFTAEHTAIDYYGRESH